MLLEGDVPWPEADAEPEPVVAPEESDFLALLAFFWSLIPALLSLDEPELPLAPLLPEALDGLGVFGGIEVEVPLPPAMPASLPVPAPDAPVAFCERTVEEGEVELLPAPVDWAMASEDIDAITTNDSVRSWVFKVIANSFN